MHAHLAAEPLFRERLRHEVRAARAVTGPFTAAVLDAGPRAPLPWPAIEYCAGPTLVSGFPTLEVMWVRLRLAIVIAIAGVRPSPLPSVFC